MNKKNAFRHAVAISVFCLFFASPLCATTPDHADFISGPLASGPEVTKMCLECHEEAATDIMQSSHWSWSAHQTINGRLVDRGKKNAINNFCVSINANWTRCTSCHIGYGWKDADFDFNDQTLVDCLVCHDTTGSYKKAPAGAGFPDPSVDLLHVARNVGKPSRENCGTCHFFGGGGDAVKHGDLDSSMEYPEKHLDVHMNTEGLDFNCQSCHATTHHQISGKSMVVSPANQAHIGCVNCHKEAPHAEAIIDNHLGKIACQTCHVPFFAKEEPTKTSWDWSTAGKDIKGGKDQYGKETYMKAKGHFTWGKNIAPTYAWYNGEAGAYLTGDTFDPRKVLKLSYPIGSRDDQDAKIYPFKIHTGKQIYDTKNNMLITPKVYGDGGYWTTFDWDKSARLGMEASGLPYSGEYGFAETIMYWRVNHMVAPKEEALTCLDCHGSNGRLDWQGLGYAGDPLLHRPMASTKTANQRSKK